MNKYIYTVVWMMVVMFGKSYAQENVTYDLGVQLFQNGQKIEAAKIWEMLSDGGDVRAMSSYAGLLFKGIGVKKNQSKAIELFEKAASLGDIGAMFNLGVILRDGIGISKDYSKAAIYFEQAARNGDMEAVHNLGHLYEHGFGVAKDLNKAKEYYLVAANSGLAISQNDLAFFYTDGQNDFPVDNEKAMYWYKKSASQLFPDALENLGIAYYWGNGIKQDYVKAYCYFISAYKNGKNSSRAYASNAFQKIKGRQENKIDKYSKLINMGVSLD